MNRTALRQPAVVLFVLQLGGCVTWQPAPNGVVEALERRPEEVRVVLGRGLTEDVRWPAVRNDSIVALTEPCPSSANGARPVCDRTGHAVAALDDVETVEVKHRSVGRTIALTASVIVGLVALPYLGYALGGPQS